MEIHLDDCGYPVEDDRLENPATIVPTDVAGEAYYRDDDPEAVLILGAGRLEPEAGAYWLHLLCGHYLFTTERIQAGFGTGFHHVCCPKCREGLPMQDPGELEE